MSEEHPSIADRDWRLHAITTLAHDFRSPWTGVLHKAGAAVEVVGVAKYKGQLLQIPVPNPCALYLSLANHAAEQAITLVNDLDGKYAGVVEKNMRTVGSQTESALFDAFENLIACLVFAYSALEAFANESLPNDFRFEKERADKRSTEVFTKDQIERYISLDTKLHEILPIIFSAKSPKGTKLWDDYIWLKDLRDRFIHLKSSDWKESGPENAEDYVWTHLLKDNVMRVPAIALFMIEHYLSPKKPRWLVKATANMKNSIA